MGAVGGIFTGMSELWKPGEPIEEGERRRLLDGQEAIATHGFCDPNHKEYPTFSERLAKIYLRAAIANEPGSRWPEKLKLIRKHCHNGALYHAAKKDPALYAAMFNAFAPPIRDNAPLITYHRFHDHGLRTTVQSRHDEDFMASMGWTATDRVFGDPKGERWLMELETVERRFPVMVLNAKTLRLRPFQWKEVPTPLCATEAAAAPGSALERFDLARWRALGENRGAELVADMERAWRQLVKDSLRIEPVQMGKPGYDRPGQRVTFNPWTELACDDPPEKPLANGWDNFGVTQYRNGVRTDGHEPMAIREVVTLEIDDADPDPPLQSILDPHYTTRDELVARSYTAKPGDTHASWASAFSYQHDRPCREIPHGA